MINPSEREPVQPFGTSHPVQSGFATEELPMHNSESASHLKRTRAAESDVASKWRMTDVEERVEQLKAEKLKQQQEESEYASQSDSGSERTVVTDAEDDSDATEANDPWSEDSETDTEDGGNATDVDGASMDAEEPADMQWAPNTAAQPPSVPAQPQGLSAAEQALVNQVAAMTAANTQAVAAGATADGVGGPAIAQDVDAAGNPIIQSVPIQGIPSNRVPGGVQNQWGVQSYGIVPAVDTEDATDNTKLRQGLVQERRLAESAYIDPTLAPVEEYLSSYQAPIPGYTPYMYGSYI